MKNLNRYFVILLLLISSLTAYAQNDSLMLRGTVIDAKTRVQLLGCKVEAFTEDNDSVPFSSTISTSSDGFDKTSMFLINVPRREGRYLLKVTKDGYDIKWQLINLTNIHKREYLRDINDIGLNREKMINMDEVVVKATKVKFYLHGDTVVYNANAFQLSDGSMLESLIRQLPGAKLTKDGKIYINGRFVESLLLNGKDFFKGNNQILLGNLPNYMVKNIKVYEKQGDKSKFLGRDAANDKEYVLDVRLKKDYALGMTGNVEVGGGTDNFYLARLFGIRFTNHSRLSVYGNVNNLNDNSQPGENGEWDPVDMKQKGVTTLKEGGLDYNVDGNKNGTKYKLLGNVNAKHTKNVTGNNTYQTNFLANGNMFNRVIDNATNKNFSIATSHMFEFDFGQQLVRIAPSFRYNNYHNKSRFFSLTSNNNNIFGQDALSDSLFGRSLSSNYLSGALNRNIKVQRTDGYDLHTGIELISFFKFKTIPDYIGLFFGASYDDASERSYDHNQIDYYNSGNIASSGFNNRFFDAKPNRGYNLQGIATYDLVINSDLSLTFYGSFEKNYKRSNSNLYQLHQIDGWGEGTEEPIGALPSYSDYLNTIDLANSYNSHLTTNTTTFKPTLSWSHKSKKAQWMAQVEIPLLFQNRRLNYLRGDIDTTFTNYNTLIDMNQTKFYFATLDRKYEVRLDYKLRTEAPDMISYLNFVDTTDPLNIKTGNPNLKNSLSQTFAFTFIRRFPRKHATIWMNALLRTKNNPIVMGYIFNNQTGVRTYKPFNADGCWTGLYRLGYDGSIGRLKKLDIRAVADVSYDHSANFTGLSDDPALTKNIVNTLLLSERLDLSYHVCKWLTLGLFSNGSWRHSTSNLEGFEKIKTMELKNGLTAKVDLPWNLELSTDMTVYTHHGYLNADMNKSEWVWNARLSYPLAKGRWLIQLDAFDILHQLSNVDRTVNAQSIVETYTNVVPRYAMLRLTYRFSTKPKKK